ncbi:hypothetical protein N0V90_003521 [Kalmusia sp. IMI 367209]|nr:hypothetical protein N0V90_003521 [Kalmusia sp. IMI 367209]
MGRGGYDMTPAPVDLLIHHEKKKADAALNIFHKVEQAAKKAEAEKTIKKHKKSSDCAKAASKTSQDIKPKPAGIREYVSK